MRFTCIWVFDDDVSATVPWEGGVICHHLPQRRIDHFKICAGVEFDDVDGVFEEIREERLIAHALNDRI